MARPRMNEGEPIGPILSASYHNQIADVLAQFEANKVRLVEPEDIEAENTVTLWVRNDTGVDLPRYSIVRVTGNLYDAASITEDQFKNRDIAFKVDKPDSTDTGTIAILVDPCKKDGIRRAVFLGWTMCTVDITDSAHTFALPIIDDTSKMTSASNGLPIFPFEAGTGEKVCAVKLAGGGSGGGAIFEAYTTAPVNGGDFDVDGINVILGNHSTDPTIGLQVKNRPGWIIDQGGWVVVAVDSDDQTLIAIQAECPEPPPYLIWRDTWTDV